MSTSLLQVTPRCGVHSNSKCLKTCASELQRAHDSTRLKTCASESQCAHDSTHLKTPRCAQDTTRLKMRASELLRARESARLKTCTSLSFSVFTAPGPPRLFTVSCARLSTILPPARQGHFPGEQTAGGPPKPTCLSSAASPGGPTSTSTSSLLVNNHVRHHIPEVAPRYPRSKNGF